MFLLDTGKDRISRRSRLEGTKKNENRHRSVSRATRFLTYETGVKIGRLLRVTCRVNPVTRLGSHVPPPEMYSRILFLDLEGEILYRAPDLLGRPLSTTFSYLVFASADTSPEHDRFLLLLLLLLRLLPRRRCSPLLPLPLLPPTVPPLLSSPASGV